MLFNSVLAGIFLLTISFIITASISLWFPNFTRQIKPYFPYEFPYTGTAVLSFILSLILAPLSNIFISETNALKKSINLIGNDLEKLIKSASENAKLISITLDTTKVYVGWVVAIPKPSNSSYITLLPVLSGYRDSDQKINFNTEYYDVYAKLLKEKSKMNINDLGFQLVISTDQIVSANLFDIQIYERLVMSKQQN